MGTFLESLPFCVELDPKMLYLTLLKMDKKPKPNLNKILKCHLLLCLYIKCDNHSILIPAADCQHLSAYFVPHKQKILSRFKLQTWLFLVLAKLWQLHICTCLGHGENKIV